MLALERRNDHGPERRFDVLGRFLAPDFPHLPTLILNSYGSQMSGQNEVLRFDSRAQFLRLLLGNAGIGGLFPAAQIARQARS